jgi:hypothetical protein
VARVRNLADAMQTVNIKVVYDEALPGQHRSIRIFHAGGLSSPQLLRTDQPPFLGRLPGFFLLRVDVPRLGAQMSASTLIFLGMKDSG